MLILMRLLLWVLQSRASQIARWSIPLYRAIAGQLLLSLAALVVTAALAILLALAWLVPKAGGWLVWDAVWGPQPVSACDAVRGEGACWAVVWDKIRFMLFGVYPFEEQWRAAVAAFWKLPPNQVREVAEHGVWNDEWAQQQIQGRYLDDDSSLHSLWKATAGMDSLKPDAPKPVPLALPAPKPLPKIKVKISGEYVIFA